MIQQNTIHLGDCLEVLRAMPDGCVDLFVQDPPYGVTQNDWDTAPELAPLWAEWLRVGKENAAFVFTATMPFGCDLIHSQRKLFRYDLVWSKVIATGFLNANRMPLRAHENVLVFYRKLPTYNPQMGTGEAYNKRTGAATANYGAYSANQVENTGTRHPKSVFQIAYEDEFFDATAKGQTIHPTQKPIDLYRYLIRTYSNVGDLVFDGFGGSGTCAVAAHAEKRRFVVVEKSPEYHAKAVERLRDYQRQLTLF